MIKIIIEVSPTSSFLLFFFFCPPESGQTITCSTSGTLFKSFLSHATSSCRISRLDPLQPFYFYRTGKHLKKKLLGTDIKTDMFIIKNKLKTVMVCIRMTQGVTLLGGLCRCGLLGVSFNTIVLAARRSFIH